MTTSPHLFRFALALRSGLLTVEDALAAAAVHSEDPEVDLDDVLIRGGYISRDDMAALVPQWEQETAGSEDERREFNDRLWELRHWGPDTIPFRRLCEAFADPESTSRDSTPRTSTLSAAPPFEEENREILQRCVVEGFLDPSSLARVASLLRTDPATPAGRILLREGFLDRQELRGLLSGLPEKILYCHACRGYLQGSADDPCPFCGGTPDLPAFLPAEAARSPEPGALPPVVSDRYEPQEEIGRGGLGRIVAARDRILGRDVAIKEMIPKGNALEQQRRFLREGEVAGRLLHPNIVPIFDLGVMRKEGEDIPYFVMGRIEGQDLHEILRTLAGWKEGMTSEFNRPKLLRIFQDVCLAMIYAHDQGIIHRDLKPANVMVGNYGEVFVIDWGLAKILQVTTDQPVSQGHVDSRYRHSEITDKILKCYYEVYNSLRPGHKEVVYERALKAELEKVFHEVTSQEEITVQYKGKAVGKYVPDLLVDGKVMIEVKAAKALASSHQLQLTQYLRATGIEVGLLLNFGGRKPSFNRRFVLASGDCIPPGEQLDRGPNQVDQSAPEGHQVDQAPPLLTLEGQVLGTPAYMPPEQARGRIEDLDERSDIYSLGAILYELLTFYPPYEGDTMEAVLSQVLSGSFTPPTQRTQQDLPPKSEKPAPRVLPKTIPPLLEGIVLKAMALRPEDRFQTVQALYDEVQLYLDGEKQARFNREQAVAKVSQGRALARSLTGLRQELEEQEGHLKEASAATMPYWSIEKKKPLWDRQEAVKSLRRRLVETTTEAGACYQEALGFERDNAQARAGLADLYWDQFLREEARGNEGEMLHFEKLVRQYNDGQYDERLEGRGNLSLAVSAFPCDCLRSGRAVPPEELNLEGYHPFSGRALDGREGCEGLAGLEPASDVHLRVHGPGCETEALEGAEVWLFRYEEKDKHLRPGLPTNVGEGVECSVSSVKAGRCAQGVLDTLHSTLDTLFDKDSPYRPEAGLYLGTAPVATVSLPMGSYLVIVHHEDYHPLRAPVLVGRRETRDMSLTLYRQDEIPEGFTLVPGGDFIWQGDPGNLHAEPRQNRHMGDFFLSRLPVTCREYLAFLHSLGPEARGRAPRESEKAGFFWPVDNSGNPVIPTAENIETHSSSWQTEPVRLTSVQVDWSEGWPCVGISWEDLITYAAWKREAEPYVYTLPLETQWEKAARGADGRYYPWGNEMEPNYSNITSTHAQSARPVDAGSMPYDESPCGIRDLGGNAIDQCMSDPGERYPNWRMVRGGCWGTSDLPARASYRSGLTANDVYRGTSGRLICLPRLPMEEGEKKSRIPTSPPQ